jgi:hypothetical protein
MAYIENITISDKSLMEIKATVGGTLLSDEIEYLIEDQQILDYVVAPTLEKFFLYFPILVDFEIYNTASSDLPLEYDAPPRTLGIMRSQFIPLSSSIPNGDPSINSFGIYANPFASANGVLSINGSYGTSSYSTPYDYGNSNFIYLNRQFQKSLESMNKAYYVRYDELKNKIYLKSDISGRFYLALGTYNDNFESSVPLRLRQSVIQYAQGLYRMRLADFLALNRDGLPFGIDLDELRTRGSELMEKELTYWSQASSIATAR